MKRRRGARPAPAVEILVECARWNGRRGVRTLLRRAIAEAASVLSTKAATRSMKTATSGAEVAIVLTDDSAIRRLNRAWRGRNEPTNVLAFPAGRQATPQRLLGDIVIAYETLAREAAAEHKPFAHHLVHLAVHGFLHLCGYDHETDRQAAAMERLEVAILARLRIPHPYIAHSRGG